MEIILSIIIGTLVYLAFGFVVFELILGSYTKKHTLQLKGFNKSDSESSMLFLVISCAAYATLITLVLHNWRMELSVLNAFVVSGSIGSLVAIMANSFWYSTTHLYDDLKPLAVDVIAAFIAVGVLGVTVNLTL